MVAALGVVTVAAVGLGWAVTGSLRRPAETVYTPDVDAYVSTAHPQANYGTTPTLRADGTPKIRSYLRFRLDGLSGRVVRAELRLWSRTGDLVGYSVHRVASSRWEERAITSTNGPLVGDPVAASGPFGPGSWSTAEVTRLVEGDEVRVAVTTTTSSHNVTFDSREGLHQPQLVVQTDGRRALGGWAHTTSAARTLDFGSSSWYGILGRQRRSGPVASVRCLPPRGEHDDATNCPGHPAVPAHCHDWDGRARGGSGRPVGGAELLGCGG
jgi:hypothetical protein